MFVDVTVTALAPCLLARSLASSPRWRGLQGLDLYGMLRRSGGCKTETGAPKMCETEPNGWKPAMGTTSSQMSGNSNESAEQMANYHTAVQLAAASQ